MFNFELFNRLVSIEWKRSKHDKMQLCLKARIEQLCISRCHKMEILNK